MVTEAGSYVRLVDSCITQLKAQGPSRWHRADDCLIRMELLGLPSEWDQIALLQLPWFELDLSEIWRLMVQIRRLGRGDLVTL